MEALLSSEGTDLEEAVAHLLTLSNDESEQIATRTLASAEEATALCDKVWDVVINQKPGVHSMCKLLHEWYHKMKPNLENLVLAQLPTLLLFYLVHRQVASTVSPTIDDIQTVLLGIYTKESPRHVWDELELKRKTSLPALSAKSIYSKGSSQVPAARPSLTTMRLTGGTKNAFRLEAGTTNRFPGVEGHIVDAYVSPVIAVCVERFGDRCSTLAEASRVRFSRVVAQLVSLGYPTWTPDASVHIRKDLQRRRVPLSDTVLQFMLNALISCAKTDTGAWEAIAAIQRRAEEHLSPALLLATSCLMVRKPVDAAGGGSVGVEQTAPLEGKGKAEEEDQEVEVEVGQENKAHPDYM